MDGQLITRAKQEIQGSVGVGRGRMDAAARPV